MFLRRRQMFAHQKINTPWPRDTSLLKTRTAVERLPIQTQSLNRHLNQNQPRQNRCLQTANLDQGPTKRDQCNLNP